MAEDIVKLLVRPGSRITPVFDPMRRYPIPRGTPSERAQKTRGWEKLVMLTEITIYLRNGVRCATMEC